MPSRREFLGAAAALPALALPDLAFAQKPSAAAPRSLKIGTVTYNIAKDWDVDTIIKNLTAVGLDGVELRTTHKHGVEISLSPAARAEVRKQFADSPVKIGGLGTTREYHFLVGTLDDRSVQVLPSSRVTCRRPSSVPA